MDKEKVIGLSNRINDVVTSERPTSISWHKIAYASELLQKELDFNFKPEMPVVFDEWFNLLNKPTQGEALSILYWIVFDVDVRTHEQQNLFDWIKGDGSESMFMRRISECVDAIKYGYEVEK